jgi:hypothetical protein
MGLRMCRLLSRWRRPKHAPLGRLYATYPRYGAYFPIC